MINENIEKSLNIAMLGGGVFLCTKKLYNLFTCRRSRMEGNVRESHNARNVICGPRAFIPSEQAQLPMDRLCVRPGLSCYWQLGDTSKMTYEQQLELDYKYIRERSVMTDLKIIIETIKSVLKGGNC